MLLFSPESRSRAPEIGISVFKGADSGTVRVISLLGKVGALSLTSSTMIRTVNSLTKLAAVLTVTSNSRVQTASRLQICGHTVGCCENLSRSLACTPTSKTQC